MLNLARRQLFLRQPIRHMATAVTSSPAAKRSNNAVLGTHDGSFHCDEALAIYMLRTLPQYSQATLRRTRDASLLDQCDIVVDVGGVYDPQRHRYDHHQRYAQGPGDGGPSWQLVQV